MLIIAKDHRCPDSSDEWW